MLVECKLTNCGFALALASNSGTFDHKAFYLEDFSGVKLIRYKDGLSTDTKPNLSASSEQVDILLLGYRL